MRVIFASFLFLLIQACDCLEARIEANHAFQAFQRKDFEKAALYYESALKQRPENTTLMKNLGFSHLEIAKNAADSTQSQLHYNKAVDVLFKVLKEQPEDRDLAAILIDAWTQTDRLQEAENYYQNYTQRFSKDPEGYRLLGQIEVHRGNYEAALKTYEKRQELMPNDLQIRAGKAILCWEWLRTGGVIDATEALRIANIGLDAALKTDAADPKHPTALVYAGLLLRQRATHQKDSKASHQDLLEAQKLLEQVRTRNKGNV